MTGRRRLALVYRDGQLMQDEGWNPFHYGVHRVYAAVAARRPDVETRLFHPLAGEDTRAFADRIEAFDPDIVGASVYVWSFEPLLELAAELKRRRRERTIIFGGPAAHPAMLSLAPYAASAHAVDALCTREGEDVMTDVLALPRLSADALRGVPGLVVRDALGFHPARARVAVAPLDELPSPFRSDVFPEGATAHLETFRGCPLSCAFCEWGINDDARRVASQGWLVEELSTFASKGLRGGFLVSAGLNLSSRAFRNLAAAEREVRFFRDAPFGCEVYPELVKDEHLEFLSNVRVRHVGVGLQSINPHALEKLRRPFHTDRFRDGVGALAAVSGATVEIIFGLPFDDLDWFRRTLEFAMGLGPEVNVLAYHCLVLPDGLMTRAPAGSEVVFDPRTLKMLSCTGWPARDIERAERMLDELVATHGGRSGHTWWHIQTNGGRAATARGRPDAPASLDLIATRAIAHAVSQATSGSWSLRGAVRTDSGARVELETGGGALRLDIEDAGRTERCYRRVGEHAYSYAGMTLDPATRGVLDRVIESIAASSSELSISSAPIASAPVPRSTPSLPPLLEVHGSELASAGDAIGAMSSGEALGVVVRGAISGPVIARVLEALQRGTGLPEVRRADVFRGVVYGRPLVAAAERSEYLEDARRFREGCAALFGDAPGLEGSLVAWLSSLAGGRPARVPVQREGAYGPATIRWLVEGDAIPLHYENETLERDVMDELRESLDPTTLMSFVISLARPREGGELRVYGAHYASLPDDFIPRSGGDDGARRVLEQDGRVTLDLEPGDLVVFDAGRYYHEVTRIVGSAPRVTLGGFLAPSRDRSTIYFWG